VRLIGPKRNPAAEYRPRRGGTRRASRRCQRMNSRSAAGDRKTPSAPILGWAIDRADRARLLGRFPPRHARTVADHVTFGREGEAPALPAAERATVIGRADDGAGVEALVVEVAGTSDRWDGSTYHITWSLGPGREAVESNAVIAEHGWTPVEGRPTVGLTPAKWP